MASIVDDYNNFCDVVENFLKGHEDLVRKVYFSFKEKEGILSVEEMLTLKEILEIISALTPYIGALSQLNSKKMIPHFMDKVGMVNVRDPKAFFNRVQELSKFISDRS